MSTSLIAVVRNLVIPLADANCLSIVLIVVLFCLLIKTDCLDSVLAIVYCFTGFYCIVRKMGSNTINCRISSYVPEFVRRRRFVRKDGSDAPKQPNSCEEKSSLDKDDKTPTRNNLPTRSGGKNRKRGNRKNKARMDITLGSFIDDDKLRTPTLNSPPPHSENNTKNGTNKQQGKNVTVGSSLNDEKLPTPTLNSPPTHSESNTKKGKKKQQRKNVTVESSVNEPAVPPGLSRKNCKKAKKKKNFAKSKFKTDDCSDGSSTKSDGSQKRDVTEKTKVYSPLKVYLDMGLEPHSFYKEFKPHALTREQLHLYEFPLDSPRTAGKVMVSAKYRKSAPERSCCRCGTTFMIHSDGRYESGTVCRYHPSKTPSYRGNNEAATYTCCNGNYISEGCIQNQYHVTAESSLKDSDFVKTREKKHLNAEKSCTIYALDCEMLYTTNGFEVAKVGIVGIDGLTLYETFVLPEKEVLCYNTTYSGVSANDLKSVTTTLRDVQAYLLKLFNKDSILVGHGLENDLRALRLIHENIVDTSVAFPHSRGVRYKRSLKSLSSEFLNKSIQEGSNGHDCIEDARTCMELMLYKIQSDIKNRPAVIVDENENSVLENVPPETHPEMVFYPFINNSYPFYFDESYLASYYPDQNCRRNSMQRPHYPYLSQTEYLTQKCYVYS